MSATIPPDADDAFALAATVLTDELRTWLRARPEAPQVHAAVLAYELAALVARHAESVPHASEVLEDLVRTMRAQIAALGVGVEHP